MKTGTEIKVSDKDSLKAKQILCMRFQISIISVAKFHEIYNFEIFHVKFKKIRETYKKMIIYRPRQV